MSEGPVYMGCNDDCPSCLAAFDDDEPDDLLEEIRNRT